MTTTDNDKRLVLQVESFTEFRAPIERSKPRGFDMVTRHGERPTSKDGQLVAACLIKAAYVPELHTGTIIAETAAEAQAAHERREAGAK